MNTCGFDAALLDLFLDGALSSEEMDRVQEHLNCCPECQAYVDDVLTMRNFFPDTEDVELPENFAAAVMAEVAKAPQSRPRKQPWAKMAAAAACLAVIVLAQQVGLPFGAKRSMAAPQAAPAEFALASMTDATSLNEEAETSNGSCDAIKEVPAAPEMAELDQALLISVAETELGEIPDGTEPSEIYSDHTCYLLEREDALTAVLVERGILEELPEDGNRIRLEVWNK